jgi:hypothetical protein
VADDNSFHLRSSLLLLIVIVDYRFVAMNPLCIGSLLDFRWLFAFVFSLGCVYLCSHLACTFDGWVPILDFYFQGFSSFIPRNLHTWVKKWSFKVQKKLQMRTKEQGRRNTQKRRTTSKWSMKLAVWTEVTVFHLFGTHQQKHVRIMSHFYHNHWLHQLLTVTHQP